MSPTPDDHETSIGTPTDLASFAQIETLDEAEFEGPEKCLEVEWKPSTDPANCHGLRRVPRERWDALLDLAQCRILSRMSNEHLDSYVLSESSLFVYPFKIVIKTCGTTSLLRCVPELLHLADEFVQTEVEAVYFSRKNFTFPDKQPAPHSSFTMEVEFLQRYFAPSDAYVLGPLTGDHWYLFVYDKTDYDRPHEFARVSRLASQSSSSLPLIDADGVPRSNTTGANKATVPNGDQDVVTANTDNESPGRRVFGLHHNKFEDMTLEILMHDLDESAMRHFFRDPHFKSARDVTLRLGIDDILPTGKCEVDDVMFEPCGYSMNGIDDESYYTIHVTPEKGISFVSFETNAPLTDPFQVVRRVIEIFKPSRFTVTLFADHHAAVLRRNVNDIKPLPGFVVRNKSVYDFDGGYDLVFWNFVRSQRSVRESLVTLKHKLSASVEELGHMSVSK